jgi:hypothetical protein
MFMHLFIKPGGGPTPPEPAPGDEAAEEEQSE